MYLGCYLTEEMPDLAVGAVPRISPFWALLVDYIGFGIGVAPAEEAAVVVVVVVLAAIEGSFC